MVALDRSNGSGCHAKPSISLELVPAASRWCSAFSGWLAVVVEIAEGWAERRRQRRALMMLSDAMLKDIGLGRGEAAREAMKPFWRK